MINSITKGIVRNIVQPIVGTGFAPVQPDQIADLQLWYEIQTANVVKDMSNNISQINDLSGNGRHATQVVESAQYVFVDDQINQNPVARSTSFLRNYVVDADFFISNNFTMISVQKRSASGQNIIFGANTKDNVVRLEFASDSSFRMVARSGTANAGITSTVRSYNASNEFFSIIVGTFSQTLGMKLYENGVLAGVAPASIVPNLQNNVARLGKYAGNQNRWFIGDLATMICYNRDLTSEEINGILAYLSETVYNIPVLGVV